MLNAIKVRIRGSQVFLNTDVVLLGVLKEHYLYKV